MRRRISFRRCRGRAAVLLAVPLLMLGLSARPGEALGDRVRVGDGDRVWLGPEAWANPLQDWRVEGGAVVAQPGKNRTAHALGRQVPAELEGPVTLSVRVRLDGAGTRAGFRVGVRDRIDDPRAALLAHGVGLNAAIGADGRLSLHDRAIDTPLMPSAGAVELALTITPADGDRAALRLLARDAAGRVAEIAQSVRAGVIVGNVALLADGPYDGPPTWPVDGPRGEARFTDWRIAGAGLRRDAEGRFGPILWSQYTLAEGRLRVSVQMPPLGDADDQTVVLEVADTGASGGWREAARGEIDADARVAVLAVDGWTHDAPAAVRLAYRW